jgi:hypothetical protein
MVGCVQGLLTGYKVGSTPPPPSGKRCTSGDLALGCCLVLNGCAPVGIGSGTTCSPIDAENTTWTYNC